MARPKKLKPQEVIDALKQSHGLKSGACEILGVNFDTLQRYIAESEEARAVVEHWRLRRKDRAEYKLDEAIERGESWAVIFTLKNAKDRGYSDKAQANLNINLSSLSDEQLERIANGEDPLKVIANA